MRDEAHRPGDGTGKKWNPRAVDTHDRARGFVRLGAVSNEMEMRMNRAGFIVDSRLS
jgi:hypothetical protein